MSYANLTGEDIHEALKNLGNYRVIQTQVVAAEGPLTVIKGWHLLSLGLRESWLKNINNPADTDHGCFQISENYHLAWLQAQPGCPEGQWRAVEDHFADEAAYVPRFTPACRYAHDMLMSLYRYAIGRGVPPSRALRVAFNGYNRGAYGAVKAYFAAETSAQIDAGTTGEDYGRWCIDASKLIRAWLLEHPNWTPH